jgi:hypothetical protein
VDKHALGYHRRSVPHRIVFDKLTQVLVFGVIQAKIADRTCSATAIRIRRDLWIEAGTFLRIEQLCLNSSNKMIGLDLGNFGVDGRIVKPPAVVKQQAAPRATAANKARNVRFWSMGRESNSVSWSPQRAGTIRP